MRTITSGHLSDQDYEDICSSPTKNSVSTVAHNVSQSTVVAHDGVAYDVLAHCTVVAFSGTVPETAQVALGNPCRVQLLSREICEPPDQARITQCYSWEVSRHSAQVQCWGVSGKPITLCGHGLLSCASVWLQRWGEVGTLWMGQTRVECHTEGELVWLRFPHARIENTSGYDALPALLGTTPTGYAAVGDDHGYLIAEFPPGTALEGITPPGDRLSAITGRALIVTCPAEIHGDATAADTPALIRYRYFAPQHGSTEDTATGSAMRILAKYWHDKGLGARLTAHQCSPRGGLLHARIDAQATWVGGSVIQKENDSD